MRTKTRARLDPNDPREVARREMLRGNPAELAAMRDQIARIFGFRIDTSVLKPEESAELLGLHKTCRRHEGYEAATAVSYGLASKLSKPERERWRELVSRACGRPGLLDDLDEDVATVRRITELAGAALTPVPTRTAAPPGSAVLPVGVWDDLLVGRLYAVDVAALTVIMFMFGGGGVHPEVKRRRTAAWGADGSLTVTDGVNRLLPSWTRPSERMGASDPVVLDSRGVETRLAEAGWLEIDRGSPREVTVRPGPRLAEKPDGR